MNLDTAIHTSQLTVEEQHLAMNVGSGDLPVLATPAMIAIMENAAMLAVAPKIPDGCTTVGGQMTCSHLHPTPLGGVVYATAQLVKEEGRKLTFHIIAKDANGIIGEADHLRFIVDKERFLSKL